jgi:predicted RNase H-like nuclease (RuvC/YqgF family)
MSQVSYIINFNKKTAVYTLKSTKDEITVDAKHKKYEWLKGQDAGRIVKISAKGRWNSSKDYYGLYDEINSSPSKKKSTVKSSVKTTKKKAKSVKDNSTELKELKTQLKELQTSNNKLKTEFTKLKNEVQLLKKKPLPAKQKPLPVKTKTNPEKKYPKEYQARITATLKYNMRRYPKSIIAKTLKIKIETKKLDIKPTQSFFKSYLKLAVQNGSASKKFGMRISRVTELSNYLHHHNENFKISNISFISIKEY